MWPHLSIDAALGSEGGNGASLKLETIRRSYETHNSKDIESYDHSLRARPRAGRGLCNSLTEHASGVGIGVLRSKTEISHTEGRSLQQGRGRSFVL